MPLDRRFVKGENGIEVPLSQEAIDQILADEVAFEVSRNAREAKYLLEKYSLVVQRAYEAGVAFPQGWKDYGTTLRLIAKGEHPGPIPKQPEKYPDQQ